MSSRHPVLAALTLSLFSIPAAAQAVTQSSQQLPTRVTVLPALDRKSVLVNSPSSVVVEQVGSVQQLRVFVDDGSVRTEVTNDPSTTYQSSNGVVVSVSSSGLMTFNAIGQADVTASFGGLTATTEIDVDPNKMPSVETVVGPAGGGVSFPDGTGVDFPPGALSSNQTIGIDEVPLPPGAVLPAGAAVVSNAYDFRPSGLSFPEAVRVTIGYSPSNIPPGFDQESLLVHTMYGGNRLDVEAYAGPEGEEHEVESVNQSLDLTNNTITIGARHFSCRAALATLNPVAVTLQAPDGTELDVLQRLRTQKPSKGPDNRYGVPNCDDNGDGNIDDCGEFEGVAGPPCTTAVDDVRVAVPTRTSASITHIVLHSTSGAAGTSFRGEVSWASNSRNCYWAQYYIGKDGTIVQISADTEIAQHVKTNNSPGHAGNGINNGNSIGIEIFNNTGVDNYPGRQLAAVVRLCDFLLRSHPTIVRPSAANPSGNIIVHAAQNPPGSVKTDPSGEFRTAAMGSPSLEFVVSRALRTDTLTGIVNSRGGDANTLGFPGFGGDVTYEMGVTALANDFDDTRGSTQVGAGATQPVGGPDLMHLLVDGKATVSADTTLDLDGILYVGPQGVLDARGGFDGNDGFDLTITADGFALIEGAVLLNGTDKLGSNEQPPFNVAPFGPGSGDGDGGNGGDLSFRSAASGFMFVPSIVTRGGDGDSSPSGTPRSGGDGGSVNVRGLNNANNERILMLARGHQNAQTANQAEIGMPDYLPQPSPFNLMPIITATPIASGTCGVSTSTTTSYTRPSSGERLALGRDIDPVTHQALGNVSLLNRGIVTVGGMGAQPASSLESGGTGGNAGTITIDNQTAGYIRFLDDVQLFAGAGLERVASVISVAGGGCGAFKFFDMPSGGLGGRGGFTGGDGGDGGNGANITVTGALWPNLIPVAPTGVTTTPVMGFDFDNPNFSGGVQIGNYVIFPNEGFSTSSTAGSGGSPAGHASSFPGNFGLMGTGGVTTVNGTIFFQ